MPLTISDTICDEEIRTPATNPAPQTQPDENDVPTATFDASAFKTSLTAIPGLTFLNVSGFPQYAEKTDFVDFTNPVTNFFLASSSSGAPFPATGTATSLKVGDTTIFLFPTSNPDIIVGRVGTEGGATDTANANGAIALVLGLQENKTGGFVTSADMWIALYAPITHNGANLTDAADQLDLANLVYLGSTFDTTTNIPFESFAGVAPGNNLFNVIFPSGADQSVQLLLTGDAGQDTVNVSSTGIGAGSQHIDVNAILRIDTVQGMIKANVDEAKEVNDPTHIVYTDTNDAGTDARVEIVGADFEITQLNPGSANERVTIKVSAFNVAGSDQGQTYLNNINSNGVAVEIDVADVIVLNGAGQPATGVTVTLAADGKSVIITGLDDGATNSTTDGYQVFFTTDGVRFDRFLITNVDGDGTTFDVGNIHVTAVQGGVDTEFAEIGSHLKFQDDGPSITASGASVTALTVDESTLLTDASGDFTGLFNAPDAGADASASVAYTLGVSAAGAVSGLVDTVSGDGVFLFLQGGKVVGRAGDNATLAATGDIVFEISVASNGTVTLDQQRAVVHTDTNNHDSTSPAMTASLISLIATASDAEPDATDDSASASVGIGDRFLFKDDGPVITAQPEGSATPNNLVVKNLPSVAAGTDSSAYVLTAGADGTKSFTIIGPADNSGDFQWTYDANTTSAITGTYKGAALYTLVVNSDGTYTFDMTGALPSSTLSLDVNDIKAGGPNSNSIIVGAINDPRSIEIAATGGPINESNDNVGVTNGNLDADEALTFKLLDGNTALNFEGISIGTKTASGGTYTYSATPAAGGEAITGSVTVAKNQPIVITATMLGNVLINSITIEKDSGSTTKIGLDDIDIFLPPNDALLSFGVRLTDGDNDFVDQSFTVSIDGNNDGIITNPVSALSAPDGAELAAMSIASGDSFANLRTDSHQDLFLM